jgi:hypothetical protein
MAKLLNCMMEEKQTTVNRAQDGSTYIGQKLVPSSLFEKKLLLRNKMIYWRNALLMYNDEMPC